MTTNYFYRDKELGTSTSGRTEPTNWAGIPEGEKIQLCPNPDKPYKARKVKDDMIVYGPGGSVLDDNHEVEKSTDFTQRKVKMRCP